MTKVSYIQRSHPRNLGFFMKLHLTRGIGESKSIQPNRSVRKSFMQVIAQDRQMDLRRLEAVNRRGAIYTQTSERVFTHICSHVEHHGSRQTANGLPNESQLTRVGEATFG